ncbi:glycosyltransferase family 4 protein [Salidesulfovibrio onnuriiensis]|uniref:glycosyltransferase family 4 protein n=1 Tax=Salidesulfovibrio onnuriiensis TaxID=2583823 RepID=UPI0011CAF484|nr:glycosyltransferase family 4 protein [Salidesulfovibrio onnuriiensis]
MKIIQVVNVRWFNATAWYGIYLSKLLKDAGHDVLVLTQRDTPPDTIARQWGLRTACPDLNTTNPLRLAKTCGEIVSLLRQFQPDIVNCHRGEGFFLWGLLKQFGFEYGLVRTRGDQRLPSSDPFNRWLHASVADAVVVTNRRMAEHFLNKMKTPERGVWLIHGGVDRSTFRFDKQNRERIRTEFNFSQDEKVIGILGRFDRVKGHREAIEAVSLLRDKGHKNVRLFLLGFDTAMNARQIQDWLEEFGIADISHISGKREDIPACISALDLAVAPSLWSEAIARAPLEIMSEGCPLVASNVGVMPDLLPETALVPPGDAQGLATALEKIIEDESFAKELVTHHEATMSQLDGADFLQRTLNLYQSLISKD